MDEAFRLGMEGLEEGTVVCAESQTKGRGRLGRRWTSQRERNLYVCYFKASITTDGCCAVNPFGGGRGGGSG